jgi:UDP-glucose 4-epimerase|tara:strand:- start:2750 stop:3628 length:879 start_codon:yes stop_codon:yes gene_type:complete
MKKVIVTGGAGFIGSHIVDKLISLGIEVIVLDNLSSGKKENINPKATFMQCDISTDRPLFDNVDTVFHLAATPQVQYSIENPTDNNNVDSLINMLSISKKSGIKRFIFTSSSSVYGNPKHTPINENHPLNPLSPYALHKLIGEQYCKLYSEIYELDTVCLRYFNAYGDRMPNKGAYRSVISIFKEQYKNNEPLNIVNDGNQRRDFVHVDDIVEANILCATREKGFKGDVFNVGTNKAYTVNEIADMFGGAKKYGEKRIEPQDSIAENAKIRLDLDWESYGNLEEWVNHYKLK